MVEEGPWGVDSESHVFEYQNDLADIGTECPNRNRDHDSYSRFLHKCAGHGTTLDLHSRPRICWLWKSWLHHGFLSVSPLCHWILAPRKCKTTHSNRLNNWIFLLLRFVAALFRCINCCLLEQHETGLYIKYTLPWAAFTSHHVLEKAFSPPTTQYSPVVSVSFANSSANHLKMPSLLKPTITSEVTCRAQSRKPLCRKLHFYKWKIYTFQSKYEKNKYARFISTLIN